MMREMDRQALILLHIPKTARTTLNRIIEWQYSPLSMFTMDSYRIRATTERFTTLSEIVRTGTHSRTFSRCPVTLIADRGVLNPGD